MYTSSRVCSCNLIEWYKSLCSHKNDEHIRQSFTVGLNHISITCHLVKEAWQNDGSDLCNNQGTAANKFSRFYQSAKFICDFQSLIQFLQRPVSACLMSYLHHHYLAVMFFINKLCSWEIILKNKRCSIVLRKEVDFASPRNTKKSTNSMVQNSDQAKKLCHKCFKVRWQTMLGCCFWAQGSSLARSTSGNYRLIYGTTGVGCTIDEGINTGPGQAGVR